MLSRQAFSSLTVAVLLLILTSFVVIHSVITLAALTLTLFTSLMALNGLLTIRRVAPDSFKMTRTVSKIFCTVGEEVKVSVEIVNVSGLSIRLMAEDVVEGLKTASGNRISGAILTENDLLKMNYVVIPKERGVYRIGPLRLRVYDQYGYAAKDLTITLQHYILVAPPMPPRVKLSETIIATRRGILMGSATTHIMGSKITYRTLREYMYDDPAKDIYWRKSAREEDDLYVKEYEKLSRMRILFLLDSTPSMIVGNGSTLLDDVISALIPIVKTLLTRGDEVTVRFVGSSGPHYEVKVVSSTDYTEFLKTLLSIKPSLERDVVVDLSSLHKRFDSVVVISRFAYSTPAGLNSLARQLANMRIRYFLILVRKSPEVQEASRIFHLIEEIENRRIEALTSTYPSIVVARSDQLFSLLSSLMDRMKRAEVR